jgi:hypothetical protein
MMKFKKPMPSAPPDLSPEEIDDFIGDVRLPLLRTTRDEISRQLAKLFEQIGHLTDPDWVANAQEVAIAELLTGGHAPAPDAEMPAAALHHALIVQKRNLDAAIHRAERHAARSAERRQAQIVLQHQTEIAALEKRRVTLALELQSVNRARERLREKIVAAGGLALLPTDSVDLLSIGYRDDPVDWAVARVISDKIMTKAEVNDAKR